MEDLDPSKKTLCLCHHGGRSRQVRPPGPQASAVGRHLKWPQSLPPPTLQMAQFLLGQGFTDVINIAGEPHKVLFSTISACDDLRVGLKSDGFILSATGGIDAYAQLADTTLARY